MIFGVFRNERGMPELANMSKYVGMDLRIAQPPLPAAVSSSGSASADVQATSSEDEAAILCGTDEWRVAVPEVQGGAKCCWVKCTSLHGESDAERSPLLLNENGMGAELDSESVNT